MALDLVLSRLDSDTHTASGKITCRSIEAEDLPAVTNLLQTAFPIRNRSYWDKGLQRLARRSPAPGFPRFGDMLTMEGRPVGVHLLIAAPRPDEPGAPVRCNGSSWYVDERFQSVRHPTADAWNQVETGRLYGSRPALAHRSDDHRARISLVQQWAFRVPAGAGPCAKPPNTASRRTGSVAGGRRTRRGSTRVGRSRGVRLHLPLVRDTHRRAARDRAAAYREICHSLCAIDL